MVFFRENLKQKLKNIIGRKKLDKIRVRITRDFLESLPVEQYRRPMVECTIVGMLRRAGIPVTGILMFRGVERGHLEVFDELNAEDMIIEWEGELEIPEIKDDDRICADHKCLIHERFAIVNSNECSRCGGTNFIKFKDLKRRNKKTTRQLFGRMYRRELCGKEHLNP